VIDLPLHAKERYEGVPESNPSSYICIKVKKKSKDLEVTPIYGFHTFSQPTRVETLSMHEAERAISDQRAHLTRYVMHSKMVLKGGDATMGGNKMVGPPVKMGLSKARLLGRLVQKGETEEAEEEDIMSDLAFRNRKGAGSRARKELLSDLGGDGLTVDDDGVLGGANDAEFGGKRRFGRLAVGKKEKKGKNKTETAKDATQSAGSASANLDEDFYQVDVAEQYEDLDFDVNEQFDDDDVDLGQDEVDGGGGFAADNDDDDMDEDDYDDEGAQAGLASKAGLRDMLAKARGENLDQTITDQNLQEKGKKTAYNRPDEPLGSLTNNDEESSKVGLNVGLTPGGDVDKKRKSDADGARSPNKNKKAKFQMKMSGKTGVELDDNGNRLITLEAIRREIWLHHGQIRMKRLMSIFSIKSKKSEDRKNVFIRAIKELCTMTQDKVDGNMLVLKQHYSNMG